MSHAIALTRLTVLVALGAFAAQAAFAQNEFDFYFADIAILQQKPIQAELKVSEAQRANMNKHADWLAAQGKSIEGQVNAKKLTPDEANRLMVAHIATMKKKVIGELSAPQLKRLRELTLQRDGLLPLLDQKMADKIGMTKAQLTKLRDKFVENDKKVKDIQATAFGPIISKYNAMKPKSQAEEQTLIGQRNKEFEAAKKKIQPQLESLRKGFEDLVESTLTKGQMDEFNALKGKPFVPPSN